MNKSEFLKHLRNLVGEGRVEEALDFLSANIRDFAAYFSNDVVMLKSQFVSAKNQFLLKGVIENTEFGRITARVNSVILEIADKIEKNVDTLENQRKGHLLHKIPSRMVKEKETKCIIRIAYFLEQLLIGLTIDEDTVFQAIQVTKLMSVELLDDNEERTFEIRTSTDEEQFIILEDCTQWIFKVRPLRVGCFPLLLKIGAVEIINGKERKRNIIIEKEIKISVNDSEVDETEFSVISIEDENSLHKIKAAKEKRQLELHEKQKLERDRYEKLEAERRKRFEEYLRQEREELIREEHPFFETRSLAKSGRPIRPKMDPMSRRVNPSCLGLIIILLILTLILFFIFKK